MKRTEILAAAERCVTHDRASTYGEAKDNFGLIAAFWSAHLDTAISAADVAQMMVLFKLARLRNNPGHVDSSIDCCGYSALAGELGAGDAIRPTNPAKPVYFDGVCQAVRSGDDHVICHLCNAKGSTEWVCPRFAA